MKPEGDKMKVQLKYTKDQQLQDSILSGETLPVVELGKINSAEGGKDMPPPDAPRSCIPTFAPDEETRAAAETLKALQGHQGTAGLPENSSLSTPPGEAEYFEGVGLMGDCLTISQETEGLLCTSHSAICARHTCKFDQYHICGNQSPSQSGGG